MGKPRRFTDEVEREIARTYQEGTSSPELAARYDCEPSLICRVLKRQGVQARHPGPPKGQPLRRFPDGQVAEIVGWYLGGETQEEIASRVGASPSTISRLLHRNGLSDLVAERLRHSHWKGGRFLDVHGYVHVRSNEFLEMGRAHSGYIREHRLVMARHLGRALHKNERVHHKNGDRADNRLENLELWIGGHPAGQRDAHCPTCTCFS